MPRETPIVTVNGLSCVLPVEEIREYLYVSGIRKINTWKIASGNEASHGLFLMDTVDLNRVGMGADNVQIRVASNTGGSLISIDYNDLIIVESSMVMTPQETPTSLHVVKIADKRHYAIRDCIGVSHSFFPTTIEANQHPDAEDNWVEILNAYWAVSGLNSSALIQTDANYPNELIKDVTYLKPQSALKVITDVLSMIGHGLFHLPDGEFTVLPLSHTIDDNTTLLNSPDSQNRLIQQKENRRIQSTFVPNSHNVIFRPTLSTPERIVAAQNLDLDAGSFPRNTFIFNTSDGNPDEQNNLASAISQRIFEGYSTANQVDAIFFGVLNFDPSPRFSEIEYYHDLMSGTVKTKVISHRTVTSAKAENILQETSSLLLRRCSDNLILYSENVEIRTNNTDVRTLSDLVGQVVALSPNALLGIDCWRVVEVSNCSPSVCPTVCFILDNCDECDSCFELRPCNVGESIRYIPMESLCGSGSTFRDGDTVLLSNDLCYQIFRSTDCSEVENGLTVVSLIPSCQDCLECLQLQGCWSSAQLTIYKDGHNLNVNDVISIDGVCYSVTDNPANCDFAVHVTIDSEGLFSGCEQCGCFLLTPCPGQPGVTPITTTGLLGEDSAIDQLEVDQIIRLDNGNCYFVSRTDADCENSEPFVTVQEIYGSCETCLCYLLENCSDDQSRIVTYSDLSELETNAVIRNAEDDTCYFIRERDVPWTGSAVEVTIDGEPYSSCPDCTDPRYSLTPICPSCEDADCESDPDATQVAGGGGVVLVTDNDLSEVVGRIIKHEGVCYFVAEVSNSTPEPYTEVVGFKAFDDCESCQRTCLWMTVDVFVGDNKIKKMRKRIVVDRVCDEKDEDIIELEECPTSN